MVLNNVTEFHKILNKSIDIVSNVEFIHNYRKHGAIWTIIELEEDILVLNKFQDQVS